MFAIEQTGAKFLLFRTQVEESRFHAVWSEFYSKLNGWFPKMTNAFELASKNGEESPYYWIEIKPAELAPKESFEAGWVNMPKEAIEYLKSLPEFVAEDFESITGLKAGPVEDEEVKAAIELLEKKGKLKDGKILSK